MGVDWVGCGVSQQVVLLCVVVYQGQYDVVGMQYQWVVDFGVGVVVVMYVQLQVELVGVVCQQQFVVCVYWFVLGCEWCLVVVVVVDGDWCVGVLYVLVFVVFGQCGVGDCEVVCYCVC